MSFNLGIAIISTSRGRASNLPYNFFIFNTDTFKAHSLSIYCNFLSIYCLPLYWKNGFWIFAEFRSLPMSTCTF